MNEGNDNSGLPDLNKTMAFMQANSAGLTLNLLYLAYICDRWLMRATDSEETTSWNPYSVNSTTFENKSDRIHQTCFVTCDGE